MYTNRNSSSEGSMASSLQLLRRSKIMSSITITITITIISVATITITITAIIIKTQLSPPSAPQNPSSASNFAVTKVFDSNNTSNYKSSSIKSNNNTSNNNNDLNNNNNSIHNIHNSKST